MKTSRFLIISGILIFILTFTVYFNTLNDTFLIDDYELLAMARNMSFVNKINLPEKGDRFIRPISNISLKLDYLLWHYNPFGYHLTNTIIHALNSILVIALTFLLLKDKLVSLFAGVLFSLHPLHPEAVTWISARYDPLCTFFYVLSLVAFIIYNDISKRKYLYIISIIFYALALLSKEIAISLPLILILYDFIFKRKFNFKLYLPYILLTIFYLTLRIALLGDIGGYKDPSSQLLFFREFGINLLIKNVGYHLPFALLFPLDREVFSIFYYRLLMTLLIIIVALAISLIGKPFKMKVVLFAVGWMFFSIIPVYNMLDVLADFAGARLVYLSSIGFCILFACLIGRRLSIQIITTCLYVVILLMNNSVWNKTAKINSEVGGIVRTFSSHENKEHLKLYFYLPDTLNSIWGAFADNRLREGISPFFAPLSIENVILLSDASPNSNFGYTIYNDIDLRSSEFQAELGEDIFFFHYNDKNNKIEDVTLKIKSNLKSKTPKFSVLNWDFHSNADIKDWKFYNFSDDKRAALNSDPYLISPVLSISPRSLGAIELKIQAESKDQTITPCEIYWISNKDKEYNYRRHIAFPLKLDGKFHIYRVPFHIYNPEWLADDFYITQIEFHPTSCLAKIDIEYFRLIPYENK